MGITGDWDQRLTRRTLLKTGGSFAASVSLIGVAGTRAFARPPFEGEPFALGIASGDPSPNGVVLWTRLAPEPLVPGGGMRNEVYGVRYELAEDEEFTQIVRRGAVEAMPDEAHSVRVELDDLEPAHEYFYRFKFGPTLSPHGRTRTAPARDARLEKLVFAFVSCQNFPDGYFTPYQEVAASEDVHAVIHLGDYIYEGPSQTFRKHEPLREIFSLDDYRVRHGQYKTDLDLQAAHAAHPWLVTWDDHEVDNNYAGLDQDPDAASPEEFIARRAAAYRAYWEHMPLRRSRKPDGAFFQLYRRFHWGDIATFNVLDGRQYRSDQVEPVCTPGQRTPSGYCPGVLEASRTMLGAEQRDWLMAELATTTARWNVLANQTGFAPWDRDTRPDRRGFGEGDNWDGYVAERQVLIDHMVASHTPNPVVITGDSHQNWVRNVPPNSTDFDQPPVATEFMGTSISTGGDPAPTEAFTRFGDDPQNPHIVFRNNNRGYVRCTLTPSTWTSEFRVVDSVRRTDAVQTSARAMFVVQNGVPGGQRVTA
jgi:alkaline phosphatase D